MSIPEWRPPSRHNIALFQADHVSHGAVERVEVSYSADQDWDVPGLRERWKPGAVFIMLRCSACPREGLVVDVVLGNA